MIAGSGISADAITIGACVLGLAGAVAIAFGEFTLALLLLIANRIADGLDGAVARATHVTDRGAFLDIVLDFVGLRRRAARLRGMECDRECTTRRVPARQLRRQRHARFSPSR